jgi:hypothetical protein
MMRLSFSQRQHSVSRRLPARFSLPRWGGTSVYLFLTLSLSLLLFVCPDARAQSLDVSVVWTRDATVTPSTVQCSRSGDVAGNPTIHLRFQQPSGAFGSYVQEIRVHETAGHYDDQVWPNLSFGGQPRPECGDPPPGTPNMLYCDQYWLAVGRHNTDHTVTATVVYFILLFPIGMMPVPVTQQITVSVRNLTVAAADPVNPDPILWDPDTMTSVPVRGTLDAAYRADVPVTLRIYTSGQGAVKTLQQTIRVDGSTDASFVWDGSQDYPLTGVAPKGVYLFKFDAGPPGHAPADLDCDKSTYLTITTPTGEAELVSDDGTTAVYNVSYTLTSTENRPASSGKIDVFDPALNVHYTKALETSDLLPGQHTVTVTMPSPQIAGTYVFLVSARDNHADRDKGHRQRWALQHNDKAEMPATIAYSHYDGNSHASLFADAMKRMGYKRHPNPWDGDDYDWWLSSPSISQMRTPLEDPFVVNNNVTGYHNPKRLATVLFSGHGKNPYALLVNGNNKDPNPPAGSQRYVVTSAYWNDHPWIQAQHCLIIETVQPGAMPFSNLDLVFLIGCDLDPKNGLDQGDDTGSLGKRFCELGAKFVIVSGWHDMITKPNETFLKGFFLPNLERGMTIWEANDRAVKDLNKRYHGAQWLPEEGNYYNHYWLLQDKKLKRPN